MVYPLEPAMFKVLSSIALIFTFLGHLVFHPVTPIDRVQSSIVMITGAHTELNLEEGTMRPYDFSCTGFAVAPNVIQTAAHCVGDNMRADGNPIKLIGADKLYDLAVYSDVALDRAPLVFREADTVQFEPLIAIGYGNGWTMPIVMKETVLIPSYKVDSEFPKEVVVTPGYVEGMSGGPVVDTDGYVVSVVQVQYRSAPVGFGVGVTLIKAFLFNTGVKAKFI